MWVCIFFFFLKGINNKIKSFQDHIISSTAGLLQVVGMWEETGEPRGKATFGEAMKSPKERCSRGRRYSGNTIQSCQNLPVDMRPSTAEELPSEKSPLIKNSRRPRYCWRSYDLASKAPFTWLAFILRTSAFRACNQGCSDSYLIFSVDVLTSRKLLKEAIRIPKFKKEKKKDQ